MGLVSLRCWMSSFFFFPLTQLKIKSVFFWLSWLICSLIAPGAFRLPQSGQMLRETLRDPLAGGLDHFAALGLSSHFIFSKTQTTRSHRLLKGQKGMDGAAGCSVPSRCSGLVHGWGIAGGSGSGGMGTGTVPSGAAGAPQGYWEPRAVSFGLYSAASRRLWAWPSTWWRAVRGRDDVGLVLQIFCGKSYRGVAKKLVLSKLSRLLVFWQLAYCPSSDLSEIFSYCSFIFSCLARKMIWIGYVIFYLLLLY